MQLNFKISDILEQVAGEYETGEQWGYSCISVLGTIQYKLGDYCDAEDVMDKYVYPLLDEMGCNCGSFHEFDDVPVAQHNKARSIWLTWAAMMAREQGL